MRLVPASLYVTRRYVQDVVEGRQSKRWSREGSRDPHAVGAVRHAERNSEKSCRGQGSIRGVTVTPRRHTATHVPVGGDRRRAPRRRGRRSTRSTHSRRDAAPAHRGRRGGRAALRRGQGPVRAAGGRRQRVARTASHAIVPEQWFARLSGCSESEARRRAARWASRLDGAARDASRSCATAPCRSPRRAHRDADGAAADPSAETQLLRIADKGEMRRPARRDQERVVAAATDETEGPQPSRTATATCGPGPRGFDTDGAFSGSDRGGRGAPRRDSKPLERQAIRRGPESRRARDHRDAYRFDALIELGRDAMHGGATSTTADGMPITPAPRRPRAAARPATHPTGEEVCEIPGVGPVPVAHARKVLLPRAPRARHHRRRRRPDRRLHHPPCPQSSQDRDRRTRPDLQGRRVRPHRASRTTPRRGLRRTTSSRPTSSSGDSASCTTTSSPTAATRSNETPTAPGPCAHPTSNEIPTRRDTPPSPCASFDRPRYRPSLDESTRTERERSCLTSAPERHGSRRARREGSRA